MDDKEERFERRLRSLGEAIDREVSPSDPGLLLRLQRAESSQHRPRGGRARRARSWYYWGWAAVLVVALVAVPYLRHLGAPTPPASKKNGQTTQKVGGQPIVLGSIAAVDFLDVQDGWVAAATGGYGSPSAVLVTKDGGTTWAERMLPGGYTAIALTALSPEEAFVLAQQTGQGQSGAAGQAVPTAILHTTDGGRTWQVVWSEAPGAQSLSNGTMAMRVGLQFFGSRGYANVGDKVLGSSDGGKTWTALTLPQGVAPVHVDFLSAQAGYVAGQICPAQAGSGAPAANCQAVLIATQDGGQTWSTVFTPTEANYWSYSDAVSFANAQDGWFFLKDVETWQGYLYRTQDGGQTWTLESSQVASGRDVAGAPDFVSPEVGWLPNNAGAAPFTDGLLVTGDGGQTWTEVGAQDEWSLSGVSLLSPTVGYAVGKGGDFQEAFLARTTDGGQTWTQVLPSPAPTSQVDFVSQKQGFGVGLPIDPTAILATSDGGATWSVVSHSAQQVEAMSFLSPSQGYLLAVDPQTPSDGALLYTQDGGESWQQTATVPMPNGQVMGPYFRFFDARQGIVETENYPDVVLEATQDGGQTWTEISSQPTGKGSYQQFAFTSPAEGFMLTTVPGPSATVPSTVTLAATSDGGKTFQTVHTWQGQSQGAGVYFLDARTGWIALEQNPYGANPSTAVLATQDGGATWTTSQLPAALPTIGQNLMLQFPTAESGWLLGNGAIYRSSDGGGTWQQMP